VNYTIAANYCIPARGLGFRLDNGPKHCWGGNDPQLEVKVNP
jgi:hypothetical protein